MSIKFIHKRNYIGKDQILSCRGGTTIGYKWDETNNRIRLAVARCSVDDNFNRHIARDIVLGRITSTRPGRYEDIDLTGVNNLTHEVVEDIVWGWLEDREKLWNMQLIDGMVH